MKVKNNTPIVVDTTNNYVWSFFDTVGEAEFVCGKKNQENDVYEVIDFEEYMKRNKEKWITGEIKEIA